MSKHKFIDKICIIATILSLLIAILFLVRGVMGFDLFVKEIGYESRLFDTSKVHTIDISMDNWDSFISNCMNEEYEVCELTIDGEVYKNVGIRGKGNTSLSNVASMDSDRYSFKVEFDQYDDTKSYYGLDKLSLNNIIQDNTYMKDYLVYQMMNEFGVDAPLCSYAYITVNGEDWGLYLAVEGVEDSFLQRNYGNDYGELYKPDSMSFGGGRGNGKEFSFGDSTGGMGSSDVKLQYIDEDEDSYSNIFDNAKTDITNADKERLIESLRILSSDENIETVVDIEEVIRYFVVHNFVCNGDSYTGSMIHNYYLYEEDGKLSMIPWDYNLAFGTFQGGNASEEVNAPIDSPVSSGSMEDRPMVNWIFSNEEYTNLYHKYFSEFLDSVDIENLINQTETLILEYVVKDPTKFCTYEEFETGVKALKEFCQLRTESVTGQLNGTIPSTKEGQETDASTLIDGSHITLSDMGTMQNGRGGMGDKMQENRESMNSTENMENPRSVENAKDTENTGNVGGMQKPEKMGEMPGDFSMEDMPQEMPETFSEEMTSEGMTMPGKTSSILDYGNWIILGATLVILIVRLVVAFKFKGKNA